MLSQSWKVESEEMKGECDAKTYADVLITLINIFAQE